MKLTAVMIFIFCIQVNAKTQTVKIFVKQEKLDKVFTEIQRQTGVGFVYKWEILQSAKPVDLQVEASLKEVLELCFKGQPLTYNLVDNTVIVSKKEITDQNNVGPEAFTIDVKGKVTNEKGEPVAEATVSVKGVKKLTTKTDENGEFLILGVEENAVLIISHVSFLSQEMKLNGKNEITVQLKLNVSDLNPVFVNNGYQVQKPNEVTGSVVVITKEQLDQRVAPDIISKLEGITNSLVFNKDPLTGTNKLRIRGESTIFGYTEPLIIVDNFRYDGDINEINPNDVESITILKDAAAASMSGGSQSGNGVIVITTKSGKANQPFKMSIVANSTIVTKPDLFYTPLISPSDYIDFEIFLFNKGKYNSELASLTQPAVSPAVEILNNRKLGLISSADSAIQIDNLRGYDWRNDYLKYIYRNAISQQYQMSLSGGSNKAGYYLSGGYDKTLSSVIGNEINRLTLNSKTSYRPFKGFEIQVTLGYSENTTISNGSSAIKEFYPYMRLVDDAGKQLPVPQHRRIWEDTIVNRGFLDPKYYPLQERNHQEALRRTFTTRLASGISYSVFSGLTASISYQYLRSGTRSKDLKKSESYYIRENTNTFAIVSNGQYISSNYPSGGELTLSSGDIISHNGRFNLDYNQKWNDHSISAFAGVEVRDSRTESNSFKYYGYDDETGSFVIPDLQTQFSRYVGITQVGSSPIGGPELGYSSTILRFRSFFSNASYIYKGRYAISGSIRYDQANIFGVKTNQKGTPLWTVGGKWDISKERLYKSNLLPDLSLRLTYGYQGNISPNAVAVTTIRYLGNALYTGLPYSQIDNFPNPKLRWEKSGQLNIGVNFAFKKNIISGSFEYFKKNGKDLIGSAPVDPTTGITRLEGNFCDMISKGIDVSLTSLNINTKNFQWRTTLNFNYASEKVTRYDEIALASTYKSGYFSPSPLVGYPLYTTFSYRWGGLDPLSGDPMVYLGDTLNKSYTSATSAGIKFSDLVYSGRYNPPIFGSIYNMISWKGISVSFNISYKLAYYFRRGTIRYNSFITNWASGHKDYLLRWQKPGDEKFTSVPSFTYPIGNTLREDFYVNSDILIEKGDHFRLQFINLTYNFNQNLIKKLKMQDLSIYFYANNLGILWRANNKRIDPDYPYLSYPQSRSYSFGLKASF